MPTTPMLGATDPRATSNPNRTRRDVRRSNRGKEREQLRREAAPFVRVRRSAS